MKRRKILNLLYGLIGFYYAFDAFLRLWNEGTFGNETHVLYLFLVGPYLGFLKLFIGLFLGVGQLLAFLDKKYSFQFTVLSLVLALIFLVTTILYYGNHIWSVPFDFIVFTLLTIGFYIPVIIPGSYFHKNLSTSNQ